MDGNQGMEFQGAPPHDQQVAVAEALNGMHAMLNHGLTALVEEQRHTAGNIQATAELMAQVLRAERLERPAAAAAVTVRPPIGTLGQASRESEIPNPPAFMAWYPASGVGCCAGPLAHWRGVAPGGGHPPGRVFLTSEQPPQPRWLWARYHD